MEPKPILFTVASLVLTVQLIFLDPVLPLVVTTQGNYISALDKITVVSQKINQPSQLASEKISPANSIVFVGDVMLGRNVENLMLRKGNNYPFLGFNLVQNYPQSHVVGNFEASMSKNHTQTPAYAMNFSVDDEFLPALKEAHFSHLSLANNHSLDSGLEGYRNAVTMLEDHSLIPFGNNQEMNKSSITYLKTNKGKVALVGINASQRIPGDEEITSTFAKASRHSSFQIAYIHWGNEYEPVHSSTQRLLSEILVDAGADLIVGHHPHVVQEIDIIKGVVVFYSLGNYIFDQYFSTEVQEGLVIGLDLQDTPAITLTPVTSAANLSQPTLMSTLEQKKFLDELSLKSHPSLRKKIQTGSIPLWDTVATSTKVAMM